MSTKKTPKKKQPPKAAAAPPAVQDLNRAERDLATALFAHGPAALAEAGMSRAEAAAFAGRPVVREFLASLSREAEHAPALAAHARFIAHRGLARLARQAVQILADAMNGYAYAKNPDGSVMMEEYEVRGAVKRRPVILVHPPADFQVDAAKDVLDRLGVQGKAKDDDADASSRQVNVNVLLAPPAASTVSVDAGFGPDATEDQRALAREQVRTVIEALAPTLGAAHAAADAKLNPGKRRRVVSRPVNGGANDAGPTDADADSGPPEGGDGDAGAGDPPAGPGAA